MDNRGMKVFYRRFRDKVSKIRSHLKVNEISRLKDLESAGRLSPPINTANTTAALRIADAEKRLKIQGREHLRKTKSAVTSRGLGASRENTGSSLISGSFDSHLNRSSESLSAHRPSAIAWDDRLTASQDGSTLRRQSKDDRTKHQNTPSSEVSRKPSVDKTEEYNNRIPVMIVEDTPEPEKPFVKPKVTGFTFVYGEDNPIPKSKDISNSEQITEPEPSNVLSISQNFIETGNVNSPRIVHKTSGSESSSEDTRGKSNSVKDDLNCIKKLGNDTKSNTKHDIDASAPSVSPTDTTKTVKSKSPSINNKPIVSSQNFSRRCNTKTSNDTKKKITRSSSTQRRNRNLNSPVSTGSDSQHKKDEEIEESKQKVETDMSSISIEADPQNNADVTSENYMKTATNMKKVDIRAVPRTTKSKSARYGAERISRGDKTNRSVDGRSLPGASRQSNIPGLNKQYSCHNYDREAMKMVSRMSFSISDGLFCLGDDPYEERRQLLLVDEHNRFVILLHKKEEYLKRIEEYIRRQLEETAHFRVGSEKRKRSPKDVWDELKNCRYLRTEDNEENIDLSTVVTLASEQLKNKHTLTYKPLFKKQKSQKKLVIDDSNQQTNGNNSDTDSDGFEST